MSTRDDLLYEAAALEREADALDAAIAELERVGRDTVTWRERLTSTRAAVARIRAIAAQLPADLAVPIPDELKSPSLARTIPPGMAHTEPASGKRRAGRPAHTQHPFPQALYDAGTNVAEWARAHDVDRVVVKSWFAPPPAGRRIPREMAEAIERELGVPATEEVWTNGIR